MKHCLLMQEKYSHPVDRAHNELSAEQIQKITGTYRSFIGVKGYPKYKNVVGYCKVVYHF